MNSNYITLNSFKCEENLTEIKIENNKIIKIDKEIITLFLKIMDNKISFIDDSEVDTDIRYNVIENIHYSFLEYRLEISDCFVNFSLTKCLLREEDLEFFQTIFKKYKISFTLFQI